MKYARRALLCRNPDLTQLVGACSSPLTISVEDTSFQIYLKDNGEK